MTWNFRLVKHTDRRLVWYAVHEVFYNDAGRPFTMTKDPVDITGKSPLEVREYLGMLRRDIKRLPILNSNRTKWVKPPWGPSKRGRTPLERAVDLELISKGKGALKDFDESQTLYIPAKRWQPTRRPRRHSKV